MGSLQIQPNKFPGDFQYTSNKVPAEFFYIDRASYVLQHEIQIQELSVMCDIMNKTTKMVKWQFLGFKDVTRFGSVIGIIADN